MSVAAESDAPVTLTVGVPDHLQVQIRVNMEHCFFSPKILKNRIVPKSRARRGPPPRTIMYASKPSATLHMARIALV